MFDLNSQFTLDNPLLPEGRYEGYINKIEVRESTKEGGYPYLGVTVNIPEEDEAIWMVWSFSPRAKSFSVAGRMKTLGLERTTFDNVDDLIEYLYEELDGVPLLCRVKHETYEGETSPKIVSLKRRED